MEGLEFVTVLDDHLANDLGIISFVFYILLCYLCENFYFFVFAVIQSLNYIVSCCGHRDHLNTCSRTAKYL